MISGGLGMWYIPTGWLDAVICGKVSGFEFLVAVVRKYKATHDSEYMSLHNHEIRLLI